MREKPYFTALFSYVRWITPAYAGKTLRLNVFLFLPQDHPRVCGKNMELVRWISGLQGSPPRMREKLCGMLSATGIPRITPAYAGKTLCLPFSRIMTWDHPRVCGKNKWYQMFIGKHLGSPPRMREKLCV